MEFLLSTVEGIGVHPRARAPHLVIYHLVIEGRALARLREGKWLVLDAGDIVVFPHGDAHEIFSDERARNDVTSAILNKISAHDLRPLQAEEAGRMSGWFVVTWCAIPLFVSPS
jgi:beta-galactosidase beta subunit